MEKEKVKLINRSNNPDPTYATEDSAGVDLRAYLENSLILKPMQRALIPTGLYIELPKGFEAQIRPRSGLAANYGITVLNSPGTIDADYRGEIKVILINLGSESFEIKSGERICQMIVAPYLQVTFLVSECLSDSARGEGGFGHTGKQ